jgi:hypothetical protein
MKRLLLVVFFILVFSICLFAENLNGIFGIPFGATRSFTEKQMREKGWVLSKEKSNSLVFEKAFGTYANVITNNIEITFFQDKLYEVEITFGFTVADDEIFKAFNILKEHFNLVYMSQDERNYDGGFEVHEINFCDKEVNRFQFIQMLNPNDNIISLRQFIITSRVITGEKRKFEEKEKNKDTLSDL